MSDHAYDCSPRPGMKTVSSGSLGRTSAIIARPKSSKTTHLPGLEIGPLAPRQVKPAILRGHLDGSRPVNFRSFIAWRHLAGAVSPLMQ